MKQILEDVHRWSRKFSNVTDLNCQTTKYGQAERVRLSSLEKCLRHKSNYSQCQIRNFGSIEPDLLQHKSCSVWVVSVPSCPIHYKKYYLLIFFMFFLIDAESFWPKKHQEVEGLLRQSSDRQNCFPCNLLAVKRNRREIKRWSIKKRLF